jgi:hypothetical protein
MVFKKYSTAPVGVSYMFMDAEKEKEFLEAPEAVRKCAMLLLEKCVRNKMDELCYGYVMDNLDRLYKRVEELEKRASNAYEV